MNKPKIEWPDSVRREMIEKSKMYYGAEKEYQFGYYDGWQKAEKQVKKVQDDSIRDIKAMLDANEALQKEVNELKKRLKLWN